MSIQVASQMPLSMAGAYSHSSQKPTGQGQQLSHDMAQEFESLMLSQLIKQMRQASGGEGMFPGDKSDTYGGMFDMMIGKHLAEGGGFGIADELAGSFHGMGLQALGQSSLPQAVTSQTAQDAYQIVNSTKEPTE